MQRVILSGAFAALATKAIAGVASDWAAPTEPLKFVDQDWEDKCEGETWPIKWSKGNGHEVALSIKNSTWSHEICKDESAPGEIDWVVEFCGGEYSLWLEQEECEALESPKFYLNCAEEDDHEGGWGDKGDDKPSKIIVVWEDADCSCTKTKETTAPTHGKPSWWDDELKCSVTSTDVAPTATHGGWSKPSSAAPVAPTQTGWGDKPVADAQGGWGDKPVAPASSAAAPSSWGAAPSKPATPVADYKGAATKIGGSAFALAAVFVGALAL